MQIRTLVPAGSPEVSVTLEGRGLKGGGRIKTTTSLQNKQILTTVRHTQLGFYREVRTDYTTPRRIFEGYSEEVP